MEWSELDRGGAMWRIPGERTKNGEPHTVPLNSLALEAIDKLAKGDRWPRRGLMFQTSSGGPFAAHAAGKRKIDAILAAEDGDDVPGWRLHDLRRTLATGFQRLGVRFEVTEAVLNHLSGARSGVAGVYQRHHWTDEKRTALQAWSDHIERVLSASEDTNVIPLAARRA